MGAMIARIAPPGGDILARLRLHVTDTLGAWAAAQPGPEAQVLARFATSESPLERVQLGVAVTRSSEADDIHLEACVTPGSVAVPVALVLGAEQRASGEDLGAAIIAGYAAMVAVGRMMDGPGVLFRGFWPSYFAAPVAAAATAARLLALDAGRTAHALAMAFATAAPNVGRPQGASLSRWLLYGLAARNGVHAALAARAGFTGDLQLLDGPWARNAFGLDPRVDRLFDAAPEGVLGGVSIKPWCAARQTMAAAQAMRELIGRQRVAGEIASIHAFVPPAYLKMVDHRLEGGDRMAFLTSLPYQVALAAFADDQAFDVRARPGAVSTEIVSLMSRTSVSADDALGRHYPHHWPARLLVMSAAGGAEREVLAVPGDPARAMTELDLRAKLHALLPASGSAMDADRLMLAARNALGGGAAIDTLLRGMQAA